MGLRLCHNRGMKIFLILMVLSGLVSCGKDSQDSKPVITIRPVKPAPSTQNYIDVVNDYRAKIGLRPFVYSPIITEVAFGHSRFMAEGYGRFGHGGWRSRCAKLRNEMRSDMCGEIVAMGQKTPEAVLEAWLGSPAHRSAIENPRYTHTGVGVAKNAEGRLYWTQMFVEL